MNSDSFLYFYLWWNPVYPDINPLDSWMS
jgi:hypothetical protein